MLCFDTFVLAVLACNQSGIRFDFYPCKMWSAIARGSLFELLYFRSLQCFITLPTCVSCTVELPKYNKTLDRHLSGTTPSRGNCSRFKSLWVRLNQNRPISSVSQLPSSEAEPGKGFGKPTRCPYPRDKNFQKTSIRSSCLYVLWKHYSKAWG